MIFIFYYFFFTATDTELKCTLNEAAAEIRKCRQLEKTLHVKDCARILIHQLSEIVLGRTFVEGDLAIPTRLYHLAKAITSQEQGDRWIKLTKMLPHVGFKDIAEIDNAITVATDNGNYFAHPRYFKVG